MNSRPLVPMSSDPNDLYPLTPGHFLVGRPLTSLPAPNLEEVNPSRLHRYARIGQARQHFWSRWSREYICELQGQKQMAKPTDQHRAGSAGAHKGRKEPSHEVASGKGGHDIHGVGWCLPPGRYSNNERHREASDQSHRSAHGPTTSRGGRLSTQLDAPCPPRVASPRARHLAINRRYNKPTIKSQNCKERK